MTPTSPRRASITASLSAPSASLRNTRWCTGMLAMTEAFLRCSNTENSAVSNCNACVGRSVHTDRHGQHPFGCMSRGPARMSTVAGHLASDARSAASENGATQGWDPLVVTAADLDGFKGDNAFEASTMQAHANACNNLYESTRASQTGAGLRAPYDLRTTVPTSVPEWPAVAPPRHDLWSHPCIRASIILNTNALKSTRERHPTTPL
jgi:hypothetical protein